MAFYLIPAFAGRCSTGNRRIRTAHFGLSAAVLAACLCLSACSSFNAARPGGEAAAKQPSAGATSISGTTVAPRVRPGNGAVVALVHESDSELAAGKKELAAAALERALRLTPTDAALWHRLARIRQEQGRWRQSIDLARKSNSLAAADQLLQAGNWLLIARAQSALGNDAAATAARRRAAELQSQQPPE